MSTRSLAMRHTFLSVLLAAAISGGCTTSREGSGKEPGEGIGNASGDDADGDGAEDDGVDDEDDWADDGPGGGCAEAVTGAREVLATYCVGCHGARPEGNEFANILDATQLVATGKVVADDPENSPLYQMISTNAMPPANIVKRPEQEDIDTVRTWIACGAEDWSGADGPQPLPYKALTERLEEMLDDVRTLLPEERVDVRYLDLYPLANAGILEPELEDYRQTLNYLMNSLSQAPEVTPLLAVGADRRLLRVRLSDYGWTPALWETLIAAYPYAVTYQESSELFPVDDDTAESLRLETATRIPAVHADWFLAHAARPPLYHALAGIPARLADLERQLGIDIAADIAGAAVARAGFRDSGPSRYNRVIERHALAPERGALWITYDFSSNAGTSNIFLHPLDFTPSSGELFFHLPNGFPAFMIVDAGGNRLDTAPTNAVQDSAASDLLMENGISCLSCHVSYGIEYAADQVRDASLGAGFSAPDLARIQALYPEQTDLDDLFTTDRQRFDTARGAAKIERLERGMLHVLDDRHRQNMDLADVAAVLGVTVDELSWAIDAVGPACPSRISALKNVPDSQIPRDAFDALFPELAAGLSLGQPIILP
jgi:hypothetical protein